MSINLKTTLRELPGSIFSDLVNLVWLDVRNNQLERLPSQIGESNSLRDILLGKNKNLPKIIIVWHMIGISLAFHVKYNDSIGHHQNALSFRIYTISCHH